MIQGHSFWDCHGKNRFQENRGDKRKTYDPKC